MDESERIRREVAKNAAELTQAWAELGRVLGRQVAYRSSHIRWMHDPPPDKIAEIEALEGLPPEDLLRWAFRHTPEEQEHLRRLRSHEFDVERARVWESRGKLFNPEFEGAIARLKEGDALGAEYAVAYIEADPWHYHSGYLKEKLARWLRRVELTDEQQERLRAALLSAIQKGRREDLSEYVSLGRKLDSTAFRRALAELAAKADAGTVYRAQRILDACQLNDSKPK